jgi:hypothetical protein
MLDAAILKNDERFEASEIRERKRETDEAFCARMMSVFAHGPRFDISAKDLRRAIPSIWNGTHPLGRSASVSDAILSTLAESDKFGPARAGYRALLAHGDPQNALARRLGEILSKKPSAWPEGVRAMGARGGPFDLERSPQAYADMIARGATSPDELARTIGARDALGIGDFMRAVFVAYAGMLARRDAAVDEGQITTLLDWGLVPDERRPLRPLFADAVPTLIDGAILPFENKAPSLELRGRLKRDLVAAIGDPRTDRKNWPGAEHERSKAEQIIRRWLIDDTVHAFLDVIERSLDQEKRRTWLHRRLFWTSYLPYISDAWVVFGESAAASLRRTDNEFVGQFGRVNDGLRSALVMDIPSRRKESNIVLRIAEWSHDGKCRIWTLPQEKAIAPNLFAKDYDRRHLMGANFEVIHGIHEGPNWWQGKIADHIQKLTNIRPNDREWRAKAR